MQPILTAHLNLVPPDKLFHYTSTEAFRCIVEHKSLWATDVFYMNDRLEVLHAIELCQQACSIMAQGKSGREREFLEALSGALDFHRADQQHIFALSFSASRDQLSQWRAYARHGGYGIAFDGEALSSIAHVHQCRLVKCIYQDDQKIEIIKEFVCAKMGEVSCVETDCDVLAVIAANAFLEIAAMMKHQGFSEEREWRMISVGSHRHIGNIQYRSTSKYLVPYVEISLEGSLTHRSEDHREYLGLCEVLVGPAPEPELSWRSCMQILLDRNVYFEQVSPSGTPYRAG